MMSRRNVGLSRMAQVFLAATALAPVLLVWAAAAYDSARIYAASAVAIALCLVVICIGLLRLAKRELQTDPLMITKALRRDKDALGFLVAYALPLVVSGEQTRLFALVVFVVIVGFTLVQLQILHVNPLLGMLGFHFYEVELKS